MKVHDGQVMDFTKGGVPYDDARFAIGYVAPIVAPVTETTYQIGQDTGEPVIPTMSFPSVQSSPEMVVTQGNVVVGETFGTSSANLPSMQGYSPWSNRVPQEIVQPFIQQVVPQVDYAGNTSGPIAQIVHRGNALPEILAKIEARREALLSVKADTTQLDWVIVMMKASI